MRRTARPPLVSFYIRNCLVGFALAAVFVVALVWFDVVGLGRLVTGSPDGPLAVFLLWFFNGIVFSGAQTSVRLLLMAEAPGRSGPSGGHPQLQALPVRAEAPRPGRPL